VPLEGLGCAFGGYKMAEIGLKRLKYALGSDEMAEMCPRCVQDA
jgi:hypothetical protein